MKKKMCFLLLAATFLAAGLAGCGASRPATGTAVTASDEAITKEQWVQLLGDKFGYNAYESTEDIYSDVDGSRAGYAQIQACAEWEILTEGAEFQPDAGATWRYAMETSVRAIGLDKLNRSNIGTEVTEDSLVGFFVSHIANVDEGTLEEPLSGTDAQLILGYAYDFASDLVLEERVEYTYQDGVQEVSANGLALSGDGRTASVRNGAAYSEGDIIYVQPSEDSAAYAVRVTGVNGDQITYERAGMEDVYEELQITGTFDGTVINVSPADGIDISESADSGGQDYAFVNYTRPVTGKKGFYPVGSSVKADKNGAVFNYNKDGVSFRVSVSDIKVTSDVDFGLFAGLKKAEATISFRDEIKAEYKMERFSKTIPLGSMEILLGSTPLTLKLDLVANVGLDGEITLSYSSVVVANVNYKKGKGLAKSVSNKDAACDLHAQVTATVEPTIKAELCCFGRGITNAKVTSGVVAIAKLDVDVLGDEPQCIDLYMYVPLRWAINEDGCVMTSISSKLKASDTVWGSDNSPITGHFHWENLQLVDACTRGKNEKVETPAVDEEGKPYDEYNLFEFEEIVFGRIEPAVQKVYLTVGEILILGIDSVPEGYSIQELVYSSDDPSVCSVSNGTISASGTGGTLLRISTPDGKYSAGVAIIVAEEYNEVSGFEPLI